jgi:DNA-binding CsgD family transcriptional regulator
MTIMGGDLVDQAANGYETNSNSELIQELAADLSSHEHELLNLILQGYNTSEMADIMGIKAASVSVERNRIIKKMRLRAEKNGKR